MDPNSMWQKADWNTCTDEVCNQYTTLECVYISATCCCPFEPSSGRLRLKCDGTRPENRFRLSAKRTSPFKSAGGRQFSRLLAAEVCAISGSNAGYTMFRGSAKCTGYPLRSRVSPLTSSPVCHRVPSHFIWTLPLLRNLNDVSNYAIRSF